MSNEVKICIIGHCLVDVTLGTAEEEPKLRFGGIAHAARTAWALRTPYKLAYFAPQYLDGQIQDFSVLYGGSSAIKIGNVLGCPNVITIGEPTEAGPQGYQFLLRDEQQTIVNEELLNEVCQDKEITDFIIFPGGFDLARVLKALSSSHAEIHIDANFTPDDPSEFATLGRKFSTIAYSTSSDIFLKRYNGSVEQLRNTLLDNYTNGFLFKENRGGARFFSTMNPESPYRIPAQIRHVQHSVGVGDCFDTVYVIYRHKVKDRTALFYASSIAAEYACTTYPEDFADAAMATLQIKEDEIIQLTGVFLPWEERPSCNIYVAAPDFGYIDRRPIEQLDESLRYHNFSSRRPIKEHGEMGTHADIQRRQALCDADLGLMEQCKIMVAVLLFNDPGTLIEIGMAYQRGMPVIVYDPYRQAENLMLTQLPKLVSSNIDEVISSVFKYAAIGYGDE